MTFKNNAREVVTSYLTALSNQDFKTARGYLKDDISFQAPIALYDNADAYFAGNEELRAKYGVKVVYDIKKRRKLGLIKAKIRRGN